MVVGVNSDEWLVLKKENFYCFEERCPTRRALEMVDDVIALMMTTQLIAIQVQSTHSGKVIFANGGDRH